jgi:Metallo-beta-lactamase superfamily
MFLKCVSGDCPDGPASASRRLSRKRRGWRGCSGGVEEVATRQAPDPDELEVSVFGPGVGECMVVHLGDAEWMVVDSCVDRESREPVALTYLTELGVDVERQVRAVVVTHWHDDHMRGAARVLEAANNAKFFCSGALDDSDFYEFVVAAEERTQTGVYDSEFLSILHLLERRAQPGARPASIGPEWSFANQCIYRGPFSNVYTLSPSSGTLSLSFQQEPRWLGQSQRSARLFDGPLPLSRMRYP